MSLKKMLIAGSAVGIAIAAMPAIANHSWSTYHWSTTDGVARPPVVDNTVGAWKPRVALAVQDWNASANIQSTLTTGTTNQKRCAMKAGTIQVCNAAYGNTGWLGIASISLSGGHIAAGTTKLNDTYFNTAQYSSESWKQLVTCQEIGHDYGLGHQDEDFSTDSTRSCMDYTSLPAGNEHPDSHDMGQLSVIYGGHSHAAASTADSGPGRGQPMDIETGDSPAEWGKAIGRDAAGRANEFVRNFNGYTIITHVTWAPHVKVAPGRAD